MERKGIDYITSVVFLCVLDGGILVSCLLFNLKNLYLYLTMKFLKNSVIISPPPPPNLLISDYTEVPIALKFSHPCLEDHHSYCINGVCAFHHELEKAICRCFTGYTGERCEHLTLTSYAVDSYEKYIAIGIGVGLLLSGFLVIFYCYIRKSTMFGIPYVLSKYLSNGHIQI
ncbi:hypothetical protein FD755_022991 [Muntiacus reevesi]|uniref:Epigen n=1 Tax=Muntiacus reevesi TaxID=9886 RepID=A0A5N3W279_MUNRE|nr:hypothetical protein FD755_022991 [Muntiacus reevesi]